MVKHTIEVSRNTNYVFSRNRQLIFKDNQQIAGQVPAEDVGIIVVDNTQTSFTHSAMLNVIESGGCIVICDEKHLPAGMLLPFSSHTEVLWRIELQTSTTRPLAKRLWKQTVTAKLIAQSDNLIPKSKAHQKLRSIAKNVKAGDATNREAHGAKVYWNAWLPELTFKRRQSEPGINSLLNYGYAVLRAAIAREIVGAGLHASVGIFHSNRSNQFCLADDLIEPLRPIVDYFVRELVLEGETEINKRTKQCLLEILTAEVQFNSEAGPLTAQLKKMVSGYVKCLQQKQSKLEFPVLCS